MWDLTGCICSALNEWGGHDWAAGVSFWYTYSNSINKQLLLGRKRTLNENLRQTQELEAIKLVDTVFIRLWKTSERALWRRQPTPKQNKKPSTAYMLAKGAPVAFQKFHPHRLEESWWYTCRILSMKSQGGSNVTWQNNMRRHLLLGNGIVNTPMHHQIKQAITKNR